MNQTISLIYLIIIPMINLHAQISKIKTHDKDKTNQNLRWYTYNIVYMFPMRLGFNKNKKNI